MLNKKTIELAIQALIDQRKTLALDANIAKVAKNVPLYMKRAFDKYNDFTDAIEELQEELDK